MPNRISHITKIFQKNSKRRTKSLDIGEPFDFKHEMHVGFDGTMRMGDGVGESKTMPVEWQNLYESQKAR